MKQRKQRKKYRFFAAFLCFCVLFTMTGIQNVFMVAAASEQEESFQKENIITAFHPLSDNVKEQTVFTGTDLDELDLSKELTVSLLRDFSEQKTEENEQENTGEPHTVTMPEYYAENVISVQTLENAQSEKREEIVTISGITWQSGPEYDGSAEGTYTFTAVLPDGYILEEGVSLPEITVTVESGTDAMIQVLLDRIAALPDAEEYLASEPDMEDEDAYAEWEEKLYEYVEEALAIWEEYGALTEEQQTQMREGELEKLDAWMEIAETLKESSQVMAADNGSHKHCVCGGNINIGDHTSHTEDIVYDNILTSDNGQLLVNGAVQSDYTLTSGSYYLADDVALNSELVIVENSTVYICLNNHTLSYDRSNGKQRVIMVGEKATLNLCTCGNSGVITGGDADSSSYGGGLYLSGNSIFNMYGGSIEGNVTSGSGGGIFSGQYAACNLYEVNICRNTGLNGAGILFSHILNIYGGEIKNNDATGYGGGIAGTAESCILQDVKICNNTAAYAAGLYWAKGNLIMSDVEISNNIVSDSTAMYPAGGVALMQGTIGISGTIIITGNQYNGKQNNFWNYCNPSATRPSKLVIVDDLDEQSVIGLTNRTTPNEAAPDPVEVASGSNHTITDADWSRFFSDVEGYKIVKDGNALFLSLPDTCDLSGLDLTAEGAKLEPNFQADITTYTATVGNDVEKVGITATLAGTTDGKTIKIKNGTDLPETDMTSGKKKEVPLAVGLNTIEITVTSGSETKTYTIEITREAPAGNPVTITSYKDGVEWTGAGAPSDSDYKLTSDGGNTFLPSLAAPDGTYKIYSGDTDTGVEVTVTGAEVTARVDYYTVTFYDGSTALTTPAQQTVLKNTAASAPATDPAKTGYTFGKWVTADGGSTAYDFTKAVTGKTSVYASWTPVSYSITYTLDGGTAAGNPASYTIESSAITLKNPTRTGYSFTGWGGTDLTGNNNTSVTIAAGSTGNREYTAYWSAADYTVTLHTNGGTGGTDLTSYTYGTGAALPTNWTKTGYIFDGWYDNESYIGTAVTNISTTDTGNKEYWAKWTDNIAPVIGTLTYNYQSKNLWHWLIGKDSLIITAPVTEEGSGADEITYTVTPEGGTASSKTATIKNGEAEIIISADFKGTISIVCIDKAGNTSAGVTVGADLGANGIIIEDNAPQIAFKAENAELLPSGEYKTAPDIVVTVADDKNNAISGGIASVSYQINGGSAKTVSHDYLASMVVNDSFTIPASEISAGETVISVTAIDHAGNSNTQNYTVKVHIHSGTLVPAVEPTCITAGNKEYYTCICGKWFSDSGSTNEITDKSSVVINALEHDFSGEYLFDTAGHWKKCSRCAETTLREEHCFEADGTQCTVCDYEKEGEGHTHIGELHSATAPTCSTKGNTAYYTCDCGRWFSDSGCTAEITDKSVIEIAALGHDFVMKHDQNEHWQQCSHCSLEQSRGLHVYDDDFDPNCNVCGYVRTIQGHTHSPALVPAKPAICTEDGHEAYYTCSCGKWFSDSGCVNEITDHASVMIGKLGHDFSGQYLFNENGHWKVCRRCGAIGTKYGHDYDNDRDTRCNDCGWKRVISGDEQTTPEPPVPSQPTEPSQLTPQLPSPTNPPERPQPAEKPEDKQEPESTKTPEPTEKPSETEKEQLPVGDGEQAVPASIDNGKIIISGEPVATGNVEGMTDTSTVLKLGDGAIIVTVVCTEQEYTAGTADTIAVANAVLTLEQIELVNNGENIEIRIDVKDISGQVPEQDKKVIENGIEEYQKEVPGLVLGMYVDISMFIRIGEGEWNAITTTKEPIEIIIGIPEKLQEKDRTYVIIRAHEGVHTLMNDMDHDPSTITVSTDLFSSYAIAYVQAEETGYKCSLCHICPTFLGLCCFVWLAITILIMIVVIILLRKKKEEQED